MDSVQNLIDLVGDFFGIIYGYIYIYIDVFFDYIYVLHLSVYFFCYTE